MITNRCKINLSGRCILCEAESWAHLGVCEYCLADLPRCPPVNLVEGMKRPPRRVRLALAPLWYQSTVKRWVKSYKFKHYEHEAKTMAELIAAQAVYLYQHQRLRMPDVLVPVPLTYGAWYRRGFNQARGLAQALGQILGIDVCEGVQRLVQKGHAHRARASEREALLSASFKTTIDFPKGTRIAIIDDVITTGATLSAMASVLPPRGVVIDAWAFAYTPPPRLN